MENHGHGDSTLVVVKKAEGLSLKKHAAAAMLIAFSYIHRPPPYGASKFKKHAFCTARNCPQNLANLLLLA